MACSRAALIPLAVRQHPFRTFLEGERAPALRAYVIAGALALGVVLARQRRMRAFGVAPSFAQLDGLFLFHEGSLAVSETVGELHLDFRHCASSASNTPAFLFFRTLSQ